jgi:signal peptidase I
MDTAAARTSERDRAPGPFGEEGEGARSRFVRPATLRRLPELVPGGRLTLTLLLVALVLLLVRFVTQPFVIPSRSMEPGLRVGDRVLVDKVAYRFGAEPQRGDVVVFDGTEYFGDGDYVKRVVGVGGDHVVCCDSQGRLTVNGRPLTEAAYLYPGDKPSSVPFDVVVPHGRLFLLGDHRSDSSDSRDHLGSPGGGMVPVDRVIGRAEWIVWPAGHWATVGRGAIPPGGSHG